MFDSVTLGEYHTPKAYRITSNYVSTLQRSHSPKPYTISPQINLITLMWSSTRDTVQICVLWLSQKYTQIPDLSLALCCVMGHSNTGAKRTPAHNWNKIVINSNNTRKFDFIFHNARKPRTSSCGSLMEKEHLIRNRLTLAPTLCV